MVHTEVLISLLGTQCATVLRSKNPLLKTYKAREVARPSFFPKPWSTPTPTPFLLTSASLPGTVLLLLPVTGAQGREVGRGHSCQTWGNQLRYSPLQGPAPLQAQRDCPILHPPAAEQTLALRKQQAALPKISALLALETVPCTHVFSACLQLQKYCKLEVLSLRRFLLLSQSSSSTGDEKGQQATVILLLSWV